MCQSLADQHRCHGKSKTYDAIYDIHCFQHRAEPVDKSCIITICQPEYA